MRPGQKKQLASFMGILQKFTIPLLSCPPVAVINGLSVVCSDAVLIKYWLPMLLPLSQDAEIEAPFAI